MAYMGGQLFVRGIELADTRVALSVEVGSDTFFSLPFDDAIEEFLSRRVVSPEEFYARLDEFRARGFTATRLATQRLREVAKAALDTHLQNGGTYEDFAARIRSQELSLGISPSNHGYLRTVFNNNTVSAYSAGRDRQLTDPVVVQAVPLRVYVSALTSRTRESHAAMHGFTWDARETDEWRSYQGPNDHNCMCSVISQESREIADRLQGEVRDWGTNPATTSRHPNEQFAGPPRIEIE